jgi:hypothetical protein
MEKINKKGSHVGVVLSFVLFITFVIYLYAITESGLELGENKENSLEYLKKQVLEFSSAELTTASVAISQPSSYDCVNLNNFFSLIDLGDRISAEDEFGNPSPVLISANQNTLSVDKEPNSYLLHIYGSPEFPVSGTGSFSGCQTLNEGSGSGFFLGLTKTENFIFEFRINKNREFYF